MAEPYAWQAVGGTIWNHKTSEDDVPLYTKPQWQGLTKLHAKLIAEYSPNIERAVMMTEQALREKNGG
jgi:N-acetyl-anhydromuramyl-L-alanine amidase AmpD